MVVEYYYFEVGSVIELGGQDVKIIIFKENFEIGEKQVIMFMNDKCVLGIGVIIDKCFIKVGMLLEEVVNLYFDMEYLYYVVVKCGVFVEIDIVNLVKSGIFKEEILCFLVDVIV